MVEAATQTIDQTDLGLLDTTDESYIDGLVRVIGPTTEIQAGSAVIKVTKIPEMIARIHDSAVASVSVEMGEEAREIFQVKFHESYLGGKHEMVGAEGTIGFLIGPRFDLQLARVFYPKNYELSVHTLTMAPDRYVSSYLRYSVGLFKLPDPEPLDSDSYFDYLVDD
ncbi:MAG: hypothetical protein HYV38_01330 [Candidatus Levybacteria bacterium]|nr:hypothetical protein [Candidatus Levybacteria bacterium]MBI2420707.1 hypothetical protein [Candidatus Levybacteria bacterium]